MRYTILVFCFNCHSSRIKIESTDIQDDLIKINGTCLGCYTGYTIIVGKEKNEEEPKHH